MGAQGLNWAVEPYDNDITMIYENLFIYLLICLFICLFVCLFIYYFHNKPWHHMNYALKYDLKFYLLST
jgi:hypothetical protein